MAAPEPVPDLPPVPPELIAALDGRDAALRAQIISEMQQLFAQFADRLDAERQRANNDGQGQQGAGGQPQVDNSQTAYSAIIPILDGIRVAFAGMKHYINPFLTDRICRFKAIWPSFGRVGQRHPRRCQS
jgi:hypothetical protein